MAGHVGRPREFDEEEVMTKIMNQFWKHGYEGTALSDIISVTGLQKGSLYKAFGSKHNMYVLALALYEQNVVNTAETLLKGGGTSYDRIKTFLSYPIEAAFSDNDRRGCFLCNASSDYTGTDTETLERVRRGFEKLTRGLRAALTDLHPKGAPDDISAKARMLLAIYSGLRVMARTAKDRKPLEQARDAALADL